MSRMYTGLGLGLCLVVSSSFTLNQKKFIKLLNNQRNGHRRLPEENKETE